MSILLHNERIQPLKYVTTDASKTVGILTFELFNGKRNLGSSTIRGHWVAKYWPEAEEFIQGKKYDAVIYQKAYFVDHARAFKGIKILDLCDPDFLHWGYQTKEMIEEVDAVTCSTEALCVALRRFTKKPVILVHDRMDLTAHTNKKTHKGNGRAKSVVWFGYSHNYSLLRPTMKAISDLGLNLICISDKPFLVPANYQKPPRGHYKTDEAYQTALDKRGWVECTNYTWSKATVNDDIIKGDIVINPTATVAKWQYKSNNKTLTGWSLGMPVAHTTKELKEFVEEEARVKESEKRLQEVKDKWDVRLSVEDYKKVIADIEELKKNAE